MYIQGDFLRIRLDEFCLHENLCCKWSFPTLSQVRVIYKQGAHCIVMSKTLYNIVIVDGLDITATYELPYVPHKGESIRYKERTLKPLIETQILDRTIKSVVHDLVSNEVRLYVE